MLNLIEKLQQIKNKKEDAINNVRLLQENAFNVDDRELEDNTKIPLFMNIALPFDQDVLLHGQQRLDGVIFKEQLAKYFDTNSSEYLYEDVDQYGSIYHYRTSSNPLKKQYVRTFLGTGNNSNQFKLAEIISYNTIMNIEYKEQTIKIYSPYVKVYPQTNGGGSMSLNTMFTKITSDNVLIKVKLYDKNDNIIYTWNTYLTDSNSSVGSYGYCERGSSQTDITEEIISKINYFKIEV